MTRIAVISDVHADVHALRDALASIERLGCDEVICAGDLLDWGLFPEQTIALLRELRIPCIRGNHDRWAVRDGRDASAWDLPRDAVAFLAELPTHITRVVDGVRVAIWHARPGSDLQGIYPDASEEELDALLTQASCDVLVVGHTHVAFARSVARGLVANPGALLRDPAHPMDQAMLFDRESGRFVPSPAPGGGTFAILELPSRTFTIHRAVDGAEVAP